MRRATASTLIASLFLFLLSLPTLHLHLSAGHDHVAVIHSHMPQTSADSSGSAHSQDAEGHEAGDFQSVPIDISALCPSALSVAPVPEFTVLLTAVFSIEPDPQPEYFQAPDPNAQGPPGVLIHHPLRSPPA
jgi:hypothetical protein